jgi:ADP-heptose:LPS heptosyltransferase
VGPLDLLVAAASAAPLRLRRIIARPAPRAVRRLLILGYGGIGDTIFFLPVLEALRRALPAASLTWVSSPVTVPSVGEEMIPATGLVDDVWLWDFEGSPGLARRAEFTARARAADFDGAVMTVATPAHYFAPALARVPVVAAHRFPGLPLKRRLVLGDPSRAALGGRAAANFGGEHWVTRNFRLLDALGIPAVENRARPCLPVGESAQARAVELLGAAGAPVVGVHLGPPTSKYFKGWEPERFGALISGLARAWPEARFMLIGGAEDQPSAARVRAAVPAPPLDFIGRTPLLETFALIERCALFLSCDTALAKAAMALGVPTATLWGPSSPVEYGAYWDAERHLDLATGIFCSPCSFSGMPRDRPLTYLTCGHHACLTEMSAEWVLDRVLARWPALPTLSKG